MKDFIALKIEANVLVDGFINSLNKKIQTFKMFRRVDGEVLIIFEKFKYEIRNAKTKTELEIVIEKARLIYDCQNDIFDKIYSWSRN